MVLSQRENCSPGMLLEGMGRSELIVWVRMSSDVLGVTEIGEQEYGYSDSRKGERLMRLREGLELVREAKRWMVSVGLLEGIFRARCPSLERTQVDEG